LLLASVVQAEITATGVAAGSAGTPANAAGANKPKANSKKAENRTTSARDLERSKYLGVVVETSLPTSDM
jgi:hypothetical protein